MSLSSTEETSRRRLRKADQPNPPALRILPKSNTMYLLILVVWLISVVWLGANVNSVYLIPKSLGLRLLSALAAGSLMVFWFYALYHYGLVVFRHIGKTGAKEAESKETAASFPSIALLYTTVDDFRYDAALSCVKQDYPNFHVFLVDVSQSQQGRDQVDEFHRSFPEETTIVRRESLEGFKARSLNLALSNQAKGYDLFALCDADGLLASDLLRQASAYFKQDERIGFVQASHNSSSSVKNAFTEHFLEETFIRWQYNNVPRNRYGFPLCLGHGIVIRTEAWARAGGFPEVVAEDVAFTITLRHQGYGGFFAENIVCGEGVPDNLGQLRKRHYRMTVADTETFRQHTVPFLKRSGANFAEKWDILTHTLRRTAGSLFLPYILILLVLSLVASDSFITTSPASSGIAAWGWVVLSWLALGSPLARVKVQMHRTPVKMFRHLSQVTSVYISFCLHSTVGILAFILARRAHFIVTGARAEEQGKRRRRGFRESVARLNPNSPAMIVIPLVLSLLLAAGAIYTLNIALLGIALAMASPAIQARFHWKQKLAEATAWLALLLILSGAVLGPLGVIGPYWQYLVPAGFSVMIRT